MMIGYEKILKPTIKAIIKSIEEGDNFRYERFGFFMREGLLSIGNTRDYVEGMRQVSHPRGVRYRLSSDQ
ncbi:hypothetical protein AKA01nite_04470 [Alkalibacterium kapii]|uniref:Uncharacterized protein n=1 Tax=Alkalibacterium kapii TaxID=426704 RepID=A0A511ARJ3_9LACT|nr:hypothetical protein AKA01nite_04470 [Alkalibacterium kapii]